MAAHMLHCDGCGLAFTASRPHARTCSHRCRQSIYRDSRRELLRDDLREIALQLVRAGEIDGATALAYVVHPSPAILKALAARREQVAA